MEVRRLNSSKRVMISTGIKLYKNQFSDKNGFTCRNHDSAMPVTGKARGIFRQIEAFALSGKCIDIEHVKDRDKNDSSHFPVVDFMREQLRKSSPTPATSDHRSALINQVERFGKIRTFADITYSNICEFDVFLTQLAAHIDVNYSYSNNYRLKISFRGGGLRLFSSFSGLSA